MGKQLINFLTTVEQFKSTKCNIHVHYINVTKISIATAILCNFCRTSRYLWYLNYLSLSQCIINILCSKHLVKFSILYK